MIEGEATGLRTRWPIAELRASSMRVRHRPLNLLALAWMRLSTRVPLFYWSSPDGEDRILAMGNAYALRASGPERFRTIRRACSAVTQHLAATAGDARRPVVRCLVGFAFDEHHGEEAASAPDSWTEGWSPQGATEENWWTPLPAAVAILPEIMVVDGPSGVYLTVIGPGLPALPPGSKIDPSDTDYRPGAIDHGRTISLVELIEGLAKRQRKDAGLDDPFNEPPVPGIPWPRPPRPPDLFRAKVAMPDLAIQAPLACEGDLPTPLFERRLRDAQARIGAGQAERIVITAPRCVRLNQEVEPVGIVVRLEEQLPDCQVFMYTVAPGIFLVGASPVRLVRAVRSRVAMSALVGAAPRDADRGTDYLLGEALRKDAAELQHYELVVAGMQAALRNFGARVRSIRPLDEPDLRLLPHSQHLEARLEAERRRSLDVLDLAGQLHPTVAAAGWPLTSAVEAVREIEGQCRGWSGGSFGWLDGKGSGDLALIQGHLLFRGDAVLTAAAFSVTAESELETARQSVERQLEASLAPLSTPLREPEERPEDKAPWLWHGCAPPKRPISPRWRHLW